MTISPPRPRAVRRTVVSGPERRGHRGYRRAPRRFGYLISALLHCGLYLGPLSVVLTAATTLRRVPWIVPVIVLVLGWSAAQALTSLGSTVARRHGRPAGARLVGAGFLAAGAAWGALVWVAPAAMIGGGRWLAAGIGAGGLASLATVTVALVTRTEAEVITWSMPCWLLAAITVAASVGDDWAILLRTDPVPRGVVLLVVILVALVRAFLPAFAGDVPERPPPAKAEVRRTFGFLLIGAAQAVCVAVLWRAGPPDLTSPAALPLLAAVPLLEALVGWHVQQVAAGLDLTESRNDYRRHVRGVTVVTVMGLLSPLGAGTALAVAAYRLPERDGVLALAAATLLGGVFAVTFLLAGRGHTVLAAALAVAPPVAILAAPLLPVGFPDRLPVLVVVLTATHLTGLLTVAHTAADHRRTP